MTKQEEINRILDRLEGGFISIHETKVALAEQGVVIKVDRELPDKTVDEINEIFERWALRPNYAKELVQKVLGEAGYVAVEPLIEE